METTTMNLYFSVSNKVYQLNDGRWRWMVSVTRNNNNKSEEEESDENGDDDNVEIESIILHPHPTAPNRTVRLKQVVKGRQYESREYVVAGGSFTVGFDVLLHGGGDDEETDSIRLEHQLVFANGRHDSHHTVPLHVVDASPKFQRQLFCKRLAKKPFVETPDHVLFWHGRAFRTGSDLTPPTRTWHSNLKPRDDHGETPSRLTASEYTDGTGTLKTKIRLLATLLRLSKNTVVYSGAGISSAAGIGTAARGSRRNGNQQISGRMARPTVTHYALAALSEAGYIEGGWVQQNHDGLPQKAGYPQEKINEIHGSWYDPSNPVVKYSGELKSEECNWMRRQAQKADLVLILGTSLGGLNADQIAHNAAERSRRGNALGMVLINLQQTEHDGTTTLRIFKETDRVFQMLLDEMGIPLVQNPSVVPRSEQECVLVPYDENGNPSESSEQKMWWDLRPGAAVRLTDGHNVAGAGQPSHRCIHDGIGTVSYWNDETVGIQLVIDGAANLCLGQWWIDAAARGGPKKLPIVNVEPKFVVVAAKNNEQMADTIPPEAPVVRPQTTTNQQARPSNKRHYRRNLSL